MAQEGEKPVEKPSLMARLGEHALEKAVGAIAVALVAWIGLNYLEVFDALLCFTPWGDGLACGRP